MAKNKKTTKKKVNSKASTKKKNAPVKKNTKVKSNNNTVKRVPKKKKAVIQKKQIKTNFNDYNTEKIKEEIKKLENNIEMIREHAHIKKVSGWGYVSFATVLLVIVFIYAILNMIGTI